MAMLLRAVVALSLLGAAVLHAAQTPSHVEEWWAAGIVFVTLAVAQAALGVAVLAVTDRRLYAAAAVVSLATIALWVGSRTIGSPIGPEAGEPEPIGRADLTATLLEVATVLAAAPLARTDSGAPAWRWASRVRVLAVTAAAALTAAVSWYGLQPTRVCGDHHADQDVLGPLAPVEGHSLLPAATPVATATVGQRVGLVVGLLRNCATTPVSLHAARLLNQVGEGQVASASRFLVASVPPAQPGSVLTTGQLAGAQPLPGRVTVQPTPGSPTRALVLELRTSRPGEFRVDAVTVSYRSGSRSYASPFASNARLAVGHGRH